MTLTTFVRTYLGKKVDFDGAKIAVAIKKGFDSIVKDDDTENLYDEKDIQKVYKEFLQSNEKNTVHLIRKCTKGMKIDTSQRDIQKAN